MKIKKDKSYFLSHHLNRLFLQVIKTASAVFSGQVVILHSSAGLGNKEPGLRSKNFQSLLNWDYTLQLLLAAGRDIESAHNMVAMAPFKEIILNGYSMKFLMV